MRNSCEDIARVRCGTLNAVAVVDTALACLGINVKVLEVVVEVNRSSTEISSEQGSVGGEDGGDIDTAPLAQGKCDTREPLVEMRNYCLLLLVCNKLGHN